MKNSSFLLTVAAPVNNLVAVDLTRRELHQQSQSVRYQKESKKESQKEGQKESQSVKDLAKREPICQRSCPGSRVVVGEWARGGQSQKHSRQARVCLLETALRLMGNW